MPQTVRTRQAARRGPNPIPRLRVAHPGISFVLPEASDPVHLFKSPG